MSERKKRVAWRHAGKDRGQEAFFLTLWQPRKLAAPTIAGHTYDEIAGMTEQQRLAMKREQEAFWGRPWEELSASPLVTTAKKATKGEL